MRTPEDMDWTVEDVPFGVGAAERELADRVRKLDLCAMHPGVRERWWAEFRVRAGLPDDAVDPVGAEGAGPPPDRVQRGPQPADLLPPAGGAARRLGFSRVPMLPRGARA